MAPNERYVTYMIHRALEGFQPILLSMTPLTNENVPIRKCIGLTVIR